MGSFGTGISWFHRGSVERQSCVTPATPLVAIADRLPVETRIESPSVISRDDGSTLYLTRLDGVEASAVETAVGAVSGVRLLEADRTGRQLRCTVAADAPTPEGTVADAGRSSSGRSLRTVPRRWWPPFGLTDRSRSSQRRSNHSSRTPQCRLSGPIRNAAWGPTTPSRSSPTSARRCATPTTRDTSFERPRGANATEIADRVGISRQTFTQHLRSAQRKVFESWQTDESTHADW